MIKEKSKNRLTKLEDGLPRYGGKDNGIEITDEARPILQGIADALNLLEESGETVYYDKPYNPGCVYPNQNMKHNPYSVPDANAAFHRCMGECLIAREWEERFLSTPRKEIIDVYIAKKMVETFVGYGIVVK